MSFLFELFVVVEESVGSADDLIAWNAPEILEFVDDVGLLVKLLHNFLSCHVIKSQNTVTDSGGLENLDPSDL